MREREREGGSERGREKEKEKDRERERERERETTLKNTISGKDILNIIQTSSKFKRLLFCISTKKFRFFAKQLFFGTEKENYPR